MRLINMMDFAQQPIPNLQIHDTVPTGRKGLLFLLCMQVFIILILIILLGINGVTLTHLNTVDMCDSTGAHVVGTTSDTSDQILNITQELLNHRANDTKIFFKLLKIRQLHTLICLMVVSVKSHSS